MHMLFGFMHSGEMTLPSESAFDPSSHLCFSDVAVDDTNSRRIVKLRLKRQRPTPFEKDLRLSSVAHRMRSAQFLLSFHFWLSEVAAQSYYSCSPTDAHLRSPASSNRSARRYRNWA